MMAIPLDPLSLAPVGRGARGRTVMEAATGSGAGEIFTSALSHGVVVPSSAAACLVAARPRFGFGMEVRRRGPSSEGGRQ
jgi:hypothetical protein